MGEGLTREEIKAIMEIIGQDGGAGSVSQGLDRYRRDCRRFSERYRQLRTEVPGKWAVFYDGGVVVTAETYDRAMQLCEEEGYPRGEVVVRCIHPPGKEPTWILSLVAQAA